MILYLIFGFISGIFIGSFGFAGWSFILSFVFTGLIVHSYKFFVEDENKKTLIFISIFLLGVSLGLLRMHFSDENHASTLSQFVGQKTEFVGVVVSEPDVREKATMLTVLLQSAKMSKVAFDTETFDTEMATTTTLPLSEKIIISTDIYPQWNYGDQISFSAKLETPTKIKSNDREFDYGGYLRVRGVWYTAGFVYPKLISQDHGNIVQKYLFQIKKSFVDALNNALPPPESDLMAGLLLGAKQSLGKERLAEFARAGVSHVVVLSGYNITIVAESVIAFFSLLPATFSFLIGCVSIILFTVLAGGGASALRATIMVLVALFARRFGRQYSAERAFGFAVVAMLLLNPLLLVFDPSFQLSILATIGIVFVSPLLEPHLSKIPEKFGLREIISATISTQLVVLPFLIYQTGILSLVALPVNILILATIPLTMFLGFLTGFFGLFSLWLSYLPAIFSYALLWYQLTVVHIGATISFGAIILPAFSPMIVVLVYTLIGAGLYFLKKKNA
jgi:competence protein ComEC